MEKKLPKLTAAEFEIMSAVWKDGESSVTGIMNSVNGDNDKALARSTIQIQIQRLEEKGWLKHRQDGNKFFFSSTTTREDAAAMIADNVRKTFFGGSCAELVRALFSSRENISAGEIEDLRNMVNEMRSKNGRG